MIIRVEYATYAVAKINPEKNFSLARIRTRILVPGRGGAPDCKWGGLSNRNQKLKPKKIPRASNKAPKKSLLKSSPPPPKKKKNTCQIFLHVPQKIPESKILNAQKSFCHLKSRVFPWDTSATLQPIELTSQLVWKLAISCFAYKRTMKIKW